MPEPNLSRVLRREMARLGLNQRSLALQAGLHKDAVRNILRGRSISPRGKTIAALAEVLGVSTGYLMSEQGELPQPQSAGTRRFPGRRPSAAQRTEILRIWDALDPERRKALLFVARAFAKDAGLIPVGDPIVMVDVAFPGGEASGHE